MSRLVPSAWAAPPRPAGRREVVTGAHIEGTGTALCDADGLARLCDTGGHVEVERAEGRGRFVLLCEHAASHIPDNMNGLGLADDVRLDHCGWDIGALAVARQVAAQLDCPLAYPTLSRLVLDCNRATDHPGLIVAETEFGVVPGNAGLTAAERAARIAAVHTPFHGAVAALIEARLNLGRQVAVVSLHSFTPLYRGQARQLDVGLVHDSDARLARSLQGLLRANGGLRVALNEPYAPSDGVLYSLARHAGQNGLPCVMIEIRNDLIRDARGQQTWAERLAKALSQVPLPERAAGHCPQSLLDDKRGLS